MSPGSTSEDFDVALDFPAPFRAGDSLRARPAIVEAIRGPCFSLGIEMGIVGVFYDSAQHRTLRGEGKGFFPLPYSQRRAKGLLFFVGVIPSSKAQPFPPPKFLVMSGAPPWRWIA